MSKTLTDDEQAIKRVLTEHIRMVSYIEGRPHQCCCGWSGNGTKGNTLLDHQARKIAKVIHAGIRITTTRCHVASPHTIQMHRAAGETLRLPCSDLLSRLK
ncbi:hypothetical protein SEA_OTTAWA_97 [Arthrobacter phage Ottawa]|nr:hypothetical protein SEA_OTTAWA_97 [Arthrobacter phage Ottawa]